MEKNSLLLIDLSRNFNLTEKKKFFINLNKGKINFIDCKQIKLKNFVDLRKSNYKKLIEEFKKSISNNGENKFFLSEMEIFNLRNDRYEYPDRILNFLIIKKIILKKKIKKVTIISDNKYTLNIFDNIDLEVEKKDFSNKNFKLTFPNLRIIKFLIKAMCLVFYLKFLKKTKKKETKKDGFYLSLYPNRFFYGKKNFFGKEENICNFLLSDETHLNLTLRKLLYFAKITSQKNILNLEQFIKVTDILLLFVKCFLKIIMFKKLKKLKINFQGLNFDDELNDIYTSSYINRSKLEIYSKAIPRFLKKKDISKFNLYMFEYSFGFYLIRTIKQFSNKVKIIGFQHGIFSNNLMWIDLIKSLKHREVYIPDSIFCLNKFSFKDYKSKYKNTKISIIKSNKTKKDLKFLNSIKINKKSNKILVLPGLHDIKDLYLYVKNTLHSYGNKQFYFKLHPKNKFYFSSEKKIKKIINFKNKFFSDVIISQDSSLHFDFLNLKRKFSVIDFDYKRNYISSYLRNNKKINFIKY